MAQAHTRPVWAGHPATNDIDLAGLTPTIQPIPAVLEALSHPQPGSQALQEMLLRTRLGTEYRLSERSIALVADLDAAVADVAARHRGPLVHFPPDSVSTLLADRVASSRTVTLLRGPGRDGALALESAADLPCEGLAIVASPSDPLGTLLAANDAVRLARSCRWLLIDERHADYAGQSLMGLAGEFTNVLVLRSFRARVGASSPEVGWAAGSPRALSLLEGVPAALPGPVVQAALAAASDLPAVRALLATVRDERSRLYRSLRKLSYLQPLPSWGPFVSARVEVGQRSVLTQALADRGIRVHAPLQPGLERYVRFGLGSRRDMEYLRQALLDSVLTMVGEPSAAGGADAYGFPLGGEKLGQPEFGQVKQRRQRSA
ncbi:MAG: aminotransferase class I/II-fold pyridoxal phosphate-dependent enzyme [Thermomicrobiales bacterium]|nr:aminotransferase class I/II-fold pyridoxal phosphate-dependent enzyme [Thermomicrobiales bacterium]